MGGVGEGPATFQVQSGPKEREGITLFGKIRYAQSRPAGFRVFKKCAGIFLFRPSLWGKFVKLDINCRYDYAYRGGDL